MELSQCDVFPQELIQNADDAGATEVKFLFDSRDNAFGTTSLINVGLSKFQGSALYVYNNGLFTEKDWTGIESIMQGSKKRDPVAAGRFGIGFNSVYHVTGKTTFLDIIKRNKTPHPQINDEFAIKPRRTFLSIIEMGEGVVFIFNLNCPRS